MTPCLRFVVKPAIDEVANNNYKNSLRVKADKVARDELKEHEEKLTREYLEASKSAMDKRLEAAIEKGAVTCEESTKGCQEG